ncbi:MAG: EVE domain-containing protein [Anaerolineae bacterium]|nr:EVE domain-containing protein [Anaerolineae bacterium]
MNYWLIKSEPDVFGIEHLQRHHETVWDGVRNYQARNYLQSARVGDVMFFYHSNIDPIGIAGLCKVVEGNVVDPSQFDPKSKYFDPKSSRAAPRWWTVRVQFVEKFAQVITLEALRQHFTPDDLVVLRKGNRLSVMPVGEDAALRLLAMER